MKITYERLIELDAVCGGYLAKNKDQENKLTYAINKKLIPQLKKILKKYNSLIEDININFCYANEKGVIVKDEKGNYQFNKENSRNRIKEVEELNQNEIELTPWIVDINTEDLTEEEKEYFNGMFIELKED